MTQEQTTAQAIACLNNLNAHAAALDELSGSWEPYYPDATDALGASAATRHWLSDMGIGAGDELPSILSDALEVRAEGYRSGGDAWTVTAVRYTLGFGGPNIFLYADVDGGQHRIEVHWWGDFASRNIYPDDASYDAILADAQMHLECYA